MQNTNIFEVARYGADLQRRLHDMPVGDPMAGAPYGEYLKSKGIGMLIGVVASVVTMGAALPLLASTVLATQIAGGVMMAGGVLSGVGAVTGNKKLTKIGGIMSLAGGVGALGASFAGAGSSTATGALASGSGSEAVSSMANSFMESANTVTGGLAYADSAGKTAAEQVAAQEQGVTLGDTPAGEASATGDLANANPYGPEVKALKPGEITLNDTAANIGSTSTAPDVAAMNMPAGPTVAANQPITPPPQSSGILDNANKFLGDNKELLKVGANAVEMGVKYGMGGDAADAQTNAALSQAKLHDANASLVGTKEEELKWQMANQNKKSIMLSADDPQLEQKLQQAKAEGTAVGIIPAMGAGGIKQTPGAQFGNASQMPTGQQVVRQATYAQPTGGIINKAAA